jgi:hypothetical protein
MRALIARKQQHRMPRHARIVAAGYPKHAIVRGTDRMAIFFGEADY